MVEPSSKQINNEEWRSNIAYVRHMLGQLRQVAHKENADMLCYLLEMAYVESGDMLSGRRPRSVLHQERN
nr:hypothetical protein [Rhizobium sp. FKY42]